MNYCFGRPKRPPDALAFLILQKRRLGGMERRFARLATHLRDSGIPVRVVTTRATLLSLRSSGINLRRGDVELLDVPLGRHWLSELGGTSPKWQWALLIAGLRTGWLTRRWRRRYLHMHVVHDPGLVTSAMSRSADRLPPLSSTIADSRSSYESTRLRGLARFSRVDCLSDSIRDHAVREAQRVGAGDLSGKARVSPGSFVEARNGDQLPMVSRSRDVVFASRMVEGKGIELLEEMEPLPPGISFYIYGQGPLAPRVPGATREFTEHLPDVLAEAKVFLSLQSGENYPSQSLLEAMTAGCAVIATDVGETEKLVDGSTGVLIPPGHPGELRAAILSLLGDVERAQQLGENARRRVLEKHTVEAFGAYFLRDVATSELATRLVDTEFV